MNKRMRKAKRLQSKIALEEWRGRKRGVMIAIKRTEDWWCGNYNRNYVKVQFHGNIIPPGYVPDTPCYRVSVWGNDDFGMDLDFEVEHEAKDMFRHITNRRVKNVNIDWLESLGFKVF